MSFSIELKVNGHPVVTVVGHNDGFVEKSPSMLCKYEAQGVVFDQQGKPKLLKLTKPVKHSRDDGLLKLCIKVLKELE